MPIRLGTPELLIIFVMVILVFGVGRIGRIAGELGKGLRAFRDGLGGSESNGTPGEKNHPRPQP